jgi:hypothetical protein
LLPLLLWQAVSMIRKMETTNKLNFALFVIYRTSVIKNISGSNLKADYIRRDCRFLPPTSIFLIIPGKAKSGIQYFQIAGS